MASTLKNTNNTVQAYVSGSCTPQAKSGGWGVVLVRTGKRLEKQGAVAHTTSNQMALTAAISALEIIKKNNSDKQIVVTTLSKYVVDGITEHIKNWKLNGWKNSSKKPVLNKDLWIHLDELNQSMNIDWIRGDKGQDELTRSETLARDARVIKKLADKVI
ncbi:ribonuclease HI [Vibrio alginolyticus]|uniref:ribonuclease H family protein n=1 Tax=Vibrio alginolyticus TaxID=663 RepID=UPI00215E1F45|nr:ribonuclease H [Vibrio alginolyticus]MCS0187466.1 ribonuclease HI [Vibrio alginolyticus]